MSDLGDSVRRTPGDVPEEGFDSHHPSQFQSEPQPMRKED